MNTNKEVLDRVYHAAYKACRRDKIKFAPSLNFEDRDVELYTPSYLYERIIIDCLAWQAIYESSCDVD